MAESVFDMMKDAANTSDPNNNNRRQAKNDLLKLNTNNPRLVRLVPYPDRPFFYRYRQVWVDLPRTKPDKNGNTMFSTMLTFPYQNDKNDKLMQLIYKIIDVNNDYRKNVDPKAHDVIPLQYPKLHKYNFPARLQPQYCVQAIEIKGATATSKGHERMAGNLPYVQMLNLTTSAFHAMMNKMTSVIQWDNAKTGKPYPISRDSNNPDFLHTSWVTDQATLALYFSRPDKRGAGYTVDSQQDNMYPALPKELYAKDNKGHYKYIDRPWYIYEPSKTRDPDFYKMALKSLTKRYVEYESKEKNSNPFADHVKQVKSNAEDDKPLHIPDQNPFASQSSSSSETTSDFVKKPLNPSMVAKSASSNKSYASMDSNGNINTNPVNSKAPDVKSTAAQKSSKSSETNSSSDQSSSSSSATSVESINDYVDSILNK